MAGCCITCSHHLITAVNFCFNLSLVLIVQDLVTESVSQWRKDEMRSTLKALKKTVDDADRAAKAKLLQNVMYQTCSLSVQIVTYSGTSTYITNTLGPQILYVIWRCPLHGGYKGHVHI